MRRTIVIAMLAITVAAGLATPGLAFESTIDATFADNGVYAVPNSEVAYLAADGATTIVVVPKYTRRGTVTTVRRLDASGQPDSTFAGDGKAELTSVGSFDVQSVSIDVDHSIILTGQAGDSVAVVKFTENGQLDAGFAGDGIRTIKGRSLAAADAVTDSQGRVLFLAVDLHFKSRKAWSDALVYRLLPHGKFDPEFGNQGVRRIDRLPDDYGAAITVDQTDRPIITGGGAFSVTKAWVTRLTQAKGRLDPTFGTDGTTVVGFGAGVNAVGLDIAVVGSSITVAAATATQDPRRTSLAGFRLTEAGQLDPTYGSGGKAYFPTAAKTEIHGLFVDADGAVISGGHRRIDQSTWVPIVGALTPDGVPDTQIDATGIADISVGNQFADARSSTVVGGQIVASIWDYSSQSDPSMLVTRLGTPTP